MEEGNVVSRKQPGLPFEIAFEGQGPGGGRHQEGIGGEVVDPRWREGLIEWEVEKDGGYRCRRARTAQLELIDILPIKPTRQPQRIRSDLALRTIISHGEARFGIHEAMLGEIGEADARFEVDL